MGTMMLGFPNRVDSATLSNGAWVGTLPLTNLQTRLIGVVARTVDATLASTKIDIDLGAGKNIRVFNLTNHNLSQFATYRLSASLDGTFTALAYDSGWQQAWPAVYPWGTLEWEDDNWWSGQYTIEEMAGYTASLNYILSANTLSRYWRLEINDTTNTAGFIQAGRMFIGPAWQPTNNFSYGNTLAWETGTVADAALSGSEYFDKRMPYRVAKFSFDWMTMDEALAQSFELTRRAGMDQEILYIHDVDDTLHALRRRFLTRARTLNPIENPYFNTGTQAYELKELL